MGQGARPKLSRRVYDTTLDGGMTAEQLRWFPVTEFNWTLEQADALKLTDLVEYFEMKDGLLKAQAFNARRRKPSSR